MMKTDEPRALAGLQEILSSDASDKLKKEAQFILSQHYSDATYAQIARISYLEGDVRVVRGWENEKATGATWEKAAANLPLETGYSLVTGDGRAEIELEDASTLYLGENSVLLCNDLHTTSGIPYTELALLSGTVTLHVQPYVAGEVFILKTPTGSVTAKYPELSFVRVNGYADGFTLAEQKDAVIQLPGVAKQAVAQGQTLAYAKSKNAIWLGPGDSGAFAEWDKWVRERVTQRSAAMAEVMQASGLNEPIPGLAEMKGQGRFFDCQPYGTCWEPYAAAHPQESNPLADALPAAGQAAPKKARSSGGGAAPALLPQDEDEFFPCFPLNAFGYRLYWGAYWGTVDASYPIDSSWRLYNWAVCHTGGWVHMRNHYVWVVGRKRHHLGPGRWVKCGHTVALVPIHPWDAKGRPPLNRKEEVLALNHKNGLRFERARLNPTGPVKLLNAPPKEFNKAIYPTLARAEEPRMEAHALKDAFVAKNAGNKGATVRPAGIPLSFDHKSQSFMMTQHGMQGNRAVTRAVPFDNHGGNLQARAGNFSGSSGSRSGNSGGSGGYRGGSSGGSSGGGSRSGGSSSSSGGARTAAEVAVAQVGEAHTAAEEAPVAVPAAQAPAAAPAEEAVTRACLHYGKPFNDSHFSC